MSYTSVYEHLRLHGRADTDVSPFRRYVLLNRVNEFTEWSFALLSFSTSPDQSIKYCYDEVLHPESRLVAVICGIWRNIWAEGSRRSKIRSRTSQTHKAVSPRGETSWRNKECTYPMSAIRSLCIVNACDNPIFVEKGRINVCSQQQHVRANTGFRVRQSGRSFSCLTESSARWRSPRRKFASASPMKDHRLKPWKTQRRTASFAVEHRVIANYSIGLEAPE